MKARQIIRDGLGEVSHALYRQASLAEAEEALDRVAELLELRWAWWTPDTAHPYNCRQAEQYSIAKGWPRELMRLWRLRQISLLTPFHIRSRFEHLPFVSWPDARGRQDYCASYQRANQILSDIGVKAMLHVPIHLSKGRIAMVNWAGNVEPAELRDVLPEISGDLLAIGHLFMRNYATASGPDGAIVEERARLTPREWDCLRTLAQGYREAEAAELLQISKSTVRFHVENIVQKFGCKNRTHAVALAAQLGLIGPIGN